jgi:hypothetical protein
MVDFEQKTYYTGEEIIREGEVGESAFLIK